MHPKLPADLDQWKPVKEVLLELAQLASLQLNCPDDPKKILMIPLAAGMNVHDAIHHAAACTGYTAAIDNQKITIAEGPKPTLDSWVAAIRGEIHRIDSPALRGLIIAPRNQTLQKMPWVWYAPSQGLWECNAWITKKLLDRNIALAMVDVGESGGSPKGRHIYQRFFETLTREKRMSGKPLLWPQSRGGLMLYNWAAEHPQNVRAIGGTYTVCNLQQWADSRVPGIVRLFGLALQDFGLTADQLQSQMSQHNPIDRLAPLVQANIPILHIHGDNDLVVPLEPNAGELVKRYQALGGNAQLITVPNKGHEVVPEFFISPPLADFFITMASRS